jgi:hypothetical protein
MLASLKTRARIALEVTTALVVTVGTLAHVLGLRPALISLLGVFLGLHLQDHAPAQRLRRLPWVGIALVLSACIGVAAAGHALATVACVVAVTLLATWVTLGLSTGPPGPLMFTITCGVSGYAATQNPAIFAPAGWAIPLYVAAGAAITYALVAVPMAWELWRGHPGAPEASGARWRLDAPSRLILVRIALGSVAAGALGLWLGINRTYWIVLTVVAVLQKSPEWQATQLRAVHRVLGTLFGVGLFAALVALEPGTVQLVALLAALQFATEIVVTRHYGVALLLITPMALLISVTAGSQPWRVLAGARLVDTLIGAAVALAASWLVDRFAARRGEPWRGPA